MSQNFTMSNTLLVLAASMYQLDTIRTAKRLGYRVVTTDNRPDNPGHSLADQAYGADTTDVDAVIEIGRSEKVTGVISPCTDVAVSTAALVARELGLVGVPPEAARILTDKTAFRRFLHEQRIPAPEFHVISGDAKQMPEVSWRNSSWIIKPDLSSGSKGIFVVRNNAELTDRITQSRGFSPTRTVLLERFIEGHQATCEGVLDDGRVRLSVVLDRQTAAVPYVVTTGHHIPTRLGYDALSRLQERLEFVLCRLGVVDGPFDCDFVWSEGEIFLLEMTPRLGGNSISQLLRVATGFDLVEYAVQQACGVRTKLPPELLVRPSAVVLLGASKSGCLCYDEHELDALSSESWVSSVALEVARGKMVAQFINGRHRVGEAYITANSRDQLDSRVQEFKRRLAIDAE
jgi:biotin carboxylase